MTKQRWDTVFSILVLCFILVYASVAIPLDFRDVNRSPQWRMQHGWDEGQNVARAMSIVQYSYKDNPIVSRDLEQVYLMISSVAQKMFSQEYDLATRIALSQRLLSTLCLCLSFFLFYTLCKMVCSPLVSFLAWVCFTSASWAYLPIGVTAKEDAFCLSITLGIFLSFISYIKKNAPWKLVLAAILIGIGGATKQYPLFLSLFFPLYFLRTKKSVKTILAETAKAACIVIASYLIVSPNFFLSQFRFSTPLALITDQQSQPGLATQLAACWGIVKSIILLRYRDFYTLLAIVFGLYAAKVPFKEKETPAFSVLKSNAFVVTFSLALYYLITLYKQSYFASVRYFMIGEIAFFFLFAVLLERLFQLKNIILKTVLLTVLLLETGMYNLHRGNFNFSLQVSSAEQTMREATNSTFDQVESFLKETKEEERKKILSNWYVYIPPEFNPTYVSKIPMGYPAAEVYLGREYGFKHLNLDLDKKLLTDEKPTMYFSVMPLHENHDENTQCFSLVKTFPAQLPVLYTNFFTAVIHFHKTRQLLALKQDPFKLPAGSTIYAYDTRSCY